MTPSQLFKQHGALHIKNVIPLEFCHFFTHVLIKKSETGQVGDEQVPNAKAIMAHDLLFDTVQERLWPTIEKITEEPLLPTYSYARLYSNGDVLEKHVDRPACEVSLTIQLGRSHHYSWPIFMGNMKYELDEGDAVLYAGCDIEHWREICNGPNDYYSGQLFIHFVRQNGDFADEAGDSKTRVAPVYKKFQTQQMEMK